MTKKKAWVFLSLWFINIEVVKAGTHKKALCNYCLIGLSLENNFKALRTARHARDRLAYTVGSRYEDTRHNDSSQYSDISVLTRLVSTRQSVPDTTITLPLTDHIVIKRTHCNSKSYQWEFHVFYRILFAIYEPSQYCTAWHAQKSRRVRVTANAVASNLGDVYCVSCVKSNDWKLKKHTQPEPFTTSISDRFILMREAARTMMTRRMIIPKESFTSLWKKSRTIFGTGSTELCDETSHAVLTCDFWSRTVSRQHSMGRIRSASTLRIQ